MNFSNPNTIMWTGIAAALFFGAIVGLLVD